MFPVKRAGDNPRNSFVKRCPEIVVEKPAEPARVGWGPNEFTSLGRGGACHPDDKVKELSIYRQLLRSLTHSAAIMGLTTAFGGCGYQPVYGGSAPETRLAVVAAPAIGGRAEALQATLAGVRGELSKSGVLRPGGGYPRVLVQLVRLDEQGTGIARFDGPEGALPLARGSVVGIVGRAWVEEAAGADPARDTGDIRRVRRYASATDPRVEEQRHSQALRSASRELGRALGRRILGEPEPENEAL
jgi:hypothetical protein